MNPDERERLRAKFMLSVMKTEECWLWLGSIPPEGDGYGFFSLGPRSERAHRAAYALFVGQIPKGKLVCHHCDNRICVRPSHLFIGTIRENNADRHAKGRTVMPRSPAVKINYAIADRIRAEYAPPLVLQRHLGVRYGLSQPVVSAILARKLWKR